MAGDVTTRLRAALQGRADIHLAILFGSAARGSTSPTSDVDVAVDAPDVDRLWLAAELSSALEREVDVVDLRAELGVPLKAALLRDGVIVHEGRPGAAGRWMSRTIAALETDRPWFARMRDAYLGQLSRR